MIFSSIEFFLFFIIVLTLLHVNKSNVIKKGILLTASYSFYGYWDYRFVFLMFIMSFAAYFFGLRLEKSEQGSTRKKWLAVSILFNLGILGFFKYYNFFIDSANSLLISLGLRLPFLDILLPVGISFITFEVISYVVDIYRNQNKSAASFWDLALLVAFFPHLIAGPILKPSHFLPQLQRDIMIRWSNIEQGMQIFIVGLIKKVVIADRMALIADPVFQHPESYSSMTIWIAVIAYAIQIYCDFSGYTDMAIGSAKCMGFEIPQNFNMPYISRSITEFWRRWHISLSTWLREYLYIPLGGNRVGNVRQYLNLAIVMLLGGLWHGASWNFVVWGGLHGGALALHKLYSKYVSERYKLDSHLYNFVSWLATFIFVCIAWIFFRSSNFDTSLYIIKKMFCLVPSQGIEWLAVPLLVIVPVLFIFHLIRVKMASYYYFDLTSFKGLLVLFFVLFGILFLMPVSSSQFIYFQF